MMPEKPKPEAFESVFNLSEKAREKKAHDIASKNDIESIRERLYRTHKALNNLPFAKGLLSEDNMERGVSNLSILLEIETRALRIKAGV